MKTDIILAGVGGQGILSIAASISLAALENNLYIKQSEVHGMSQRGGAVYSHLRISDKPIASDLIPLGKADLILSVEPMEALRYVNYLSKDSWIVTSSNTFKNIDDYPIEDDIYKELEKFQNMIMLDADKIALNVGSKLSSNMVMLGAASKFLGIDYKSISDSVVKLFERKGQKVVEKNLMALEEGRKVSSSAVNV
jgi:indolepyruvate ferredoxin oxidoreductase beta subunit